MTARSGSSRREERWRRRDRIPSEFRLVYVAPNERWMRAAALAVASPLLVAVPAAALRPASVLLAAEWQVLLGGVLYGLLAAAVLLLTWRYPFRMYHSAARRQFRAVLTGPLLLNSRQLSLPEGSVSRVRSVSNMMPWMDSLYKSQQGKLVLLDTGFQSAEMFNRLLGHHVDEDGDSGVRAAIARWCCRSVLGRLSLPQVPSEGVAVRWFRSKPSIAEDMASADLVIGHAGAGTCLEALRAGRALVVVTNTTLMDNHQAELAGRLAADGHLLHCVCETLRDTLAGWICLSCGRCRRPTRHRSPSTSNGDWG
ncbi:UDP-N-acetylglucosamine transferase subunit ALG13 [Amphibalanus amphitrite]|uniref:UDP-N-acetylglucosamine transferase subunit ALG13 n=1 Tax=Amphibalanus amphitrite TaxID=1232801 RepID=A0A6A4VWJ3_AMPAM|nr:UDP-N-acetylglucosamine transferase subunit ALG13 [Amphibalanus amphitrite]